MSHSEQSELHFNFLYPSECKPVKLFILFQLSKYRFHLNRSLASVSYPFFTQ